MALLELKKRKLEKLALAEQTAVVTIESPKTNGTTADKPKEKKAVKVEPKTEPIDPS